MDQPLAASPSTGLPAKRGPLAPWIRRSHDLSIKIAAILVTLAAIALTALVILAWVSRRDESQLAVIASTTNGGMTAMADACVADLGGVATRQLSLVIAVSSAHSEFQAQVSDWKSLLQRGSRPDQRAKFTTDFNARETEVRKHCSEASRLIGDDAGLRANLDAFLAAYDKLLRSYRNGMGMIDMAETYADGAKSADDYMIGRDLEPVRTLDTLVEQVRGRALEHARQTAAEGRARIEATATSGRDRIGGTITQAQHRNLLISMAVGIAMVITAGLAFQLVRTGFRPLQATASALDELARGNLSVRPPPAGPDEIGRMTEALGRAIQGTRDSVERMTEDAAALNTAMHGLNQCSGTLTAQSRQTIDETIAAEAAAGRIAQGAQSAAAAMEEMASSVHEISGTCEQAARITTAAAAEVGQAESAVNRLAERSAEIAAVTKAIAAIAAQTNLLALNATIEAARAGEAGRGFAVVAEEVKQLARKSATAAADIGSRLAAIQEGSSEVEQALKAIVDRIRRIDAMMGTIAGAMEQQSAGASQVSSEVQQVAIASSDIAGRLASTGTAARAADAEAQRIALEAGQLADIVRRQREVISRFTI